MATKRCGHLPFLATSPALRCSLTHTSPAVCNRSRLSLQRGVHANGLARRTWLSRHRTLAKVVERVKPARVSQQASRARVPTSATSQHASTSTVHLHSHPPHPQEEPLFLPRKTATDQAALHTSGFRDMDVDSFNAMMEDEGVLSRS